MGAVERKFSPFANHCEKAEILTYGPKVPKGVLAADLKDGINAFLKPIIKVKGNGIAHQRGSREGVQAAWDGNHPGREAEAKISEANTEAHGDDEEPQGAGGPGQGGQAIEGMSAEGMKSFSIAGCGKGIQSLRFPKSRPDADLEDGFSEFQKSIAKEEENAG